MLQKIVILGHSLGAAVTMHDAAQSPNNVTGLVVQCEFQSATHILTVRQRMIGTSANTRKQGIAFAAKLAAQTNFPSDELQLVDSACRKVVERAVAGAQPEIEG